MSTENKPEVAAPDDEIDRREAVRKLGRFAAVTPPTVALLLAGASRPARAVAISVDVSSPAP